MKKNSYLLLGILIISISLLTSCSKASNNVETTNGFIENSWYNNVILSEGENLYLEYPIYITKPFDYDLNINLNSNEKYINISSINNILIDKTTNFNKYQLSYNLHLPSNFNETKKISNGTLNLNINNNKYTVNLGNSLVSVLYNPDKSISVEGGTLLIDRMETNEYDISYNLKNTTNDTLVIKDIKLNNDENFKIENFNETTLIGQNSSTINFTLKINPSIKNTRVQPKIIYENKKGDKLESTLTTFIIADPIPEDTIKNKHKIF